MFQCVIAFVWKNFSCLVKKNGPFVKHSIQFIKMHPANSGHNSTIHP